MIDRFYLRYGRESHFFAYIVLIHNLLLYILTLRGTVWVTLSTLESILEPSRFF